MSRCQLFFFHITRYFFLDMQIWHVCTIYFFLDCSTKGRFLSLTSVDPSIKSPRKQRNASFYSLGSMDHLGASRVFLSNRTKPRLEVPCSDVVALFARVLVHLTSSSYTLTALSYLTSSRIERSWLNDYHFTK